jgi:hypothetical protein
MQPTLPLNHSSLGLLLLLSASCASSPVVQDRQDLPFGNLAPTPDWGKPTVMRPPDLQAAERDTALAAMSGGNLRGGRGDEAAAPVDECRSPGQGWIWCDDFEQDRLSRYFEYSAAGGAFSRIAGVGVDGSAGMRVRFAAGQVDAGALHLAFGRTPSHYFRPVDDGERDYREVFWRVFLRNQPGWVGGSGIKFSRATVFATGSWAQAMVAHVWGTDGDYLFIEPVRGTDGAGKLVTTTYNDFDHFTWLGGQRSKTPVFDAAHLGQWRCYEAQVRLNDAGQDNGEFRLWIDGRLEAERTDYNFLGAYHEYGINALFLENYWNEGSPVAQERYFDRLVVSTQRIGC